MKYALISAVLGMILAQPAQATVPGIEAYNLIKLQDDHNPLTISDKVVYYLDRDWKRHPFPNLKTFNSWHFDFLQLKELKPEDMAQFRMGTPIRYRPGTRLVKIASVPSVYAVEPGGILRAIGSEQIARDLYGADWNKRIDDVDEAFFSTYTLGAPLNVPVWPTGTLLHRTSDDAFFVTNGMMKHPVSRESMTALRLWKFNAIDTDSDLADYGDGGEFFPDDIRLTDTAELSRFDTEPAPTIDFPYKHGIKPGADTVMAAMRITVGAPVNLSKLTIVLGGLPKSGPSPITRLHITDAQGNDLFGIQELTLNGTGTETLVFTGAAGLPRNSASAIQFRADVSMTLDSGTQLSFGFPQSGISFNDGGNGDKLKQFWYPSTTFSKAK